MRSGSHAQESGHGGLRRPGGAGTQTLVRRVQNILPKVLDFHHKSSVTSVLRERNNHLRPSGGHRVAQDKVLPRLAISLREWHVPRGMQHRSGTIL